MRKCHLMGGPSDNYVMPGFDDEDIPDLLHSRVAYFNPDLLTVFGAVYPPELPLPCVHAVAVYKYCWTDQLHRYEFIGMQDD